MCALGLGWCWLWDCLAEEPSVFPKRGSSGKILLKARKAGIKLKPKAAAMKHGSMGQCELPGAGWPWRSCPTSMILWVNLLWPPFYNLRVSCQDFFLVGPAAPGKNPFSHTSTAPWASSRLQITWMSWSRKQLLLGQGVVFVLLLQGRCPSQRNGTGCDLGFRKQFQAKCLCCLEPDLPNPRSWQINKHTFNDSGCFSKGWSIPGLEGIDIEGTFGSGTVSGPLISSKFLSSSSCSSSSSSAMSSS